MISLKDHIIEGIFDDENVIMNKTIKSATKARSAEIRNWVKIHVQNDRGTMKIYEENGDVIVKFSGKTRWITIDYTNIPEGVKFDFLNSACDKLVLNNPCDKFMEYIIADSLDEICINRAENATKAGKVNIKSIDMLSYLINDKSKLHTLTRFKNCEIQYMFLELADQPSLSFDINLNGLDIKRLIRIVGHYNYNKTTDPYGFVVKTKGNYNTKGIEVDYGANVEGLPSKLTELTYESWNTVLSGDVKEVDKLYLKVCPSDKFVKLQDELNRLKQIISGEITLPKFKKLVFDTPYGDWKCKEKDLKDTINTIIGSIKK